MKPADLGTVLGVWAHPDDEVYLSGGLMARARDAGNRVVCVTATLGEHGTGDRPDRGDRRSGPAGDRPDGSARTTQTAGVVTLLGEDTMRDWCATERSSPLTVPEVDRLICAG